MRNLNRAWWRFCRYSGVSRQMSVMCVTTSRASSGLTKALSRFPRNGWVERPPPTRRAKPSSVEPSAFRSDVGDVRDDLEGFVRLDEGVEPFPKKRLGGEAAADSEVEAELCGAVGLPI